MVEVVPGPRVLHCELAAYSANALALLRACATVEPAAHPDELERELGEGCYDAVFVGIGNQVSRKAIESAARLRWIVTPTTGTSHIDLEAARERGVRVLSLADQPRFLRGVRATAEHTFGLLLALRRRLLESIDLVRAGQWARADLLGEDLSGTTMGVLGHGRLGRMVAELAGAFRMNVLVCDTDAAAVAAAPAGVEAVGLRTLLGASDVVSVHVPLNDSTREMLGPAEFAALKPGAVLLNTARGEVLSEAALLAALESGRLAGAALDVLADDSSWFARSPDHHPLLGYAAQHPNLLITPHIGGYSRQAVQATREFIVQAFIDVVRTDLSTRGTPCPR